MGAQPIMPEKFAERNGGKSLDLDCLIGLTEEGHLHLIYTRNNRIIRDGMPKCSRTSPCPDLCKMSSRTVRENQAATAGPAAAKLLGKSIEGTFCTGLNAPGV